GDDWPALAAREVHHVAGPVALVAAATLARARAAAALVRVEYEALPAVLDLDAALGRATPHVLAEHALEHGDVDAALARAAHVIEGSYETAHQEHAYIETQGMLAIPDED